MRNGKLFASTISRVLFSAFVFFALLEIILRTSLFSYLKTYHEKDGRWYESPFKMHETDWYHLNLPKRCVSQGKSEFNYESCYNSLGIRDIEHTLIKPAGVKRVMALGDSFTEGIGAPFDSTWWNLLSNILENERPDSFSYEFISGGVHGSDPFFSFVLLRDKLIKYEPDLVILAMNESDLNDIAIKGGMERFLPDSTLNFRNNGPWWEPFYACSFIFRLILFHSREMDAWFRSADEIKADHEYAIAEICNVLNRTDTYCKSRNINFLALAHPQYWEILGLKNPFADVGRHCDSTGIDYFNLHQGFFELASRDSIEDYFWPVDGHCTPKGYLFIAQEIFNKMQSE